MITRSLARRLRLLLLPLLAILFSSSTNAQTINPNQISGTFTSNFVHTGAETFTTLNKVVYWDGTTYPFTAAGLQAGINAACNGSTPGTFVVSGPGTTSMGTTQVNVPNSCDVGGSGQTIPTLQWSASRNGTLIGASSGSPSGIRIHDLIIDGSSGTGSSQSGIFMGALTSPTDITVERVTVQNIGSYGIDITGTSGNPGLRVKVLGCKILNAGLATGAVGQLYGILVSNDSKVSIIDNEIANGGITGGIVSFNGTNASSGSAITDIQVIGNKVHDLTFNTTPGTGIDIGRARNVVASGNSCFNLAQGGCIFYESVWGGSITGNVVSPSNTTTTTGGPITIKIPDTTQSGEVSSQDISITGNTIQDQSTASTTPSSITVNGAARNITISGNVLSFANQATNNPQGILLNPGTNDANISASSQNFCNVFSVTGNTIVNRPGTSSATAKGISVSQGASGCALDQVEVSGNSINGFLSGIVWSSVSATDGVTHTYIHDNALEGNTTGYKASDANTYNSVYYWNMLQPSGTGPQSANIPSSTTFAFQNTYKQCWINAAGSGYDCAGETQHVRGVAGCTTAASIGGVCASAITVNWTSPFSGTNYTPKCMPSGAPTNLPGTPYVASKLPGSITVNYFAITAAAASWATIDCEATHD